MTTPFRDDVVRDRVAPVTGASTGIGKQIARTLGLHGGRLAICGRCHLYMDGGSGVDLLKLKLS